MDILSVNFWTGNSVSNWPLCGSRNIARLADIDFELHEFSLIISEQALRQRITKDVEQHRRTPDVLDRSLSRLRLYEGMSTTKIDVSYVTARQVAEQIVRLVTDV